MSEIEFTVRLITGALIAIFGMIVGAWMARK